MATMVEYMMHGIGNSKQLLFVSLWHFRNVGSDMMSEQASEWAWQPCHHFSKFQNHIVYNIYNGMVNVWLVTHIAHGNHVDFSSQHWAHVAKIQIYTKRTRSISHFNAILLLMVTFVVVSILLQMLHISMMANGVRERDWIHLIQLQ